MLELRYWPDEILNQKAIRVSDIDSEVKNIGKQMLDLMQRSRGIGLAGPQAGITKRIFVTFVEGDKPRIFINPEIVQTSIEEYDFEEGCLSFPKLYFSLRRPESVKIQAWNERARPFSLEASGLLARVILHEYDHIEGIVFIDRLNDERRKEVLEEYKEFSKKI